MILSIIPLLIFFVVAFFVARLTWRRMASGRFPPLPATAPVAPASARAVEAVVFATLGTILIVLSGTQQSYGGYLLMLGDISNPLALAVVTATIVALLLVLLAALLSWLGRSTGAFITSAAAVIAYGLFLNAGHTPAFGLIKSSNRTSTVLLTINASGEDVPGARLWVNGVDLGALPYHGTLGEFLAKVPVWKEPPADYETDTTDRIHYYFSANPNTVHERRWITFNLPPIPNADGQFAHEDEGKEKVKYYARVQYAGEWALATGNSGGGGGGGGLFFSAQSNFGITLPERQKRLDTLLNIARANDYHVDAAWLAAAETFRSDGIDAILKARDDEPQMQNIWDTWARSKYPVDSATTPDAAWAIFQRICDDADAANSYETMTPQGRALELLAPRLPADRLLRAAGDMLRQVRGGYSYSFGTRFGEFHFATQSEGRTLANPAARDSVARPNAFVTAHALWVFHQAQLKAGVSPTLIQARVVPDLLRLNPVGETNLRVAAFLGGPLAADFILRHDWHAQVEYSNFDDRFWFHGENVNKWLYLAAHMQDPAAREFRRAHPDELLKLAAQLTPDMSNEIGGDVDFLFEDPNLAARFWPQFSAKMQAGSSFNKLQTLFGFLTRMNAPPDLYLEAWRKHASDAFSDPTGDLARLAKIDDPARRQAVINVMRTADVPKERLRWGYQTDTAARSAMNTALDAAERPQVNALANRRLLEIRQLTRPTDLARIANWLRHSNDTPASLPDLLAVDTNPQLRQLAIQPLALRPTSEHRALLATLAQDPDPAVQQAAQQALKDLATLRTSPPPTSER